MKKLGFQYEKEISYECSKVQYIWKASNVDCICNGTIEEIGVNEWP